LAHSYDTSAGDTSFGRVYGESMEPTVACTRCGEIGVVVKAISVAPPAGRGRLRLRPTGLTSY